MIQNDETVSLTLPTPVPLQDVESIGFRKSAGDPWDVEWVALRARGGGIDRTGAIQEPAPYAVGGNDFRTFTLTPTW